MCALQVPVPVPTAPPASARLRCVAVSSLLELNRAATAAQHQSEPVRSVDPALDLVIKEQQVVRDGNSTISGVVK